MNNILTNSTDPYVVFITQSRKLVKIFRRANPSNSNFLWWGPDKTADVVRRHLDQARSATVFIIEGDGFGKMCRIVLDSWKRKGYIDKNAHIISLPPEMKQTVM